MHLTAMNLFVLLLASMLGLAVGTTASDANASPASPSVASSVSASPTPVLEKHAYAGFTFQNLSELSTPPASFISLAKGIIYDNGSLVTRPSISLDGFKPLVDYIDTKVPDYMIHRIYADPTLKYIVLDSKAIVPVTFSMAMLALHYVSYSALTDVADKSLIADVGSLDSKPAVSASAHKGSPAQRNRLYRMMMSIVGAFMGALRSIFYSVYVRVPWGILVALFVTLATAVFQHFYTIVYLSYASHGDNVFSVYKGITNVILPLEVIFCFLFAIKVATPVYNLHDPKSLKSGLMYAFGFYFVRRVFRNTWDLFGVSMVPVFFIFIAGIFAYDKDAMTEMVLKPIFRLPVRLYAYYYLSDDALPPISKKKNTLHAKAASEDAYNKLSAKVHGLVQSQLYHGLLMALVFLVALMVGRFIPELLGNKPIHESAWSMLEVPKAIFGLLYGIISPIVYRVFSFLSIDFWFTAAYTLIGWDGFLFPSVTRESSSPALSGTIVAARNETFLMVLSGGELVFNSTDVCLNRSLHPYLGPAAPTNFFSSELNVTNFDVKLADSFYHWIHSREDVHAIFHSGFVVPTLYLSVMVYKFMVGFYKKQEAQKAASPASTADLSSLSMLTFETVTPILVVAVVYAAQHVLLQALVYYYDPSVVDQKTMVAALFAKFTPLSTMGTSALAGSLAVVAYQAFRPTSYSFFFSVFYNLGFFYVRAVLKTILMEQYRLLTVSEKTEGSFLTKLVQRAWTLSGGNVSHVAGRDILGVAFLVSLAFALFAGIQRKARAKWSKLAIQSIGLMSQYKDALLLGGLAVMFNSGSLEKSLGVIRSIFSTLQYEFKYNIGYELGNYGDIFSSLDQSISELPLLANIFESTPMLASGLARLATENL